MNKFDTFFLSNGENCSYYASITSDKSSFLFSLLNLNKKQFIYKSCYSISQLMTEIEIIFKRSFKAVILEVFNAPLFAPYRSNHEFCQALKTKFVQLQIPTYFLTNEEWLFARIFAYKNYSSSINDIISAILVDGDMGSVAYYKYTQNGYEMLSPNIIKITSSTEMNQREALQRNPKTVFLLPTRCPTGIHLEWLKSSLSKVTNLVDLTTGFSFSEDVFIQALHGIIDKDSFQCKFVPLCFKEAYVRTLNDPCPIITTNVIIGHGSLPLQIAKIVDKIVDKIVVFYEDQNTGGNPAIIYTCIPNSLGHKHEIILKIDEENFISYEINPIILAEIQQLPKMLGMKKVKVPVIAFLNNLSLICIPMAENMEYEFLQSWKGIYGKDLYLSFDKKKPSFGENASKFLQTTPTCVVYDIIKIMSSSSEALKAYKSKSFKITKDDKNPVLIEFVNYEEKLKQASPSLLMALMLKEHLKAIEEKFGEKPKEVAFVLFGEFAGDGRKRVETQVNESCEMLKVSCKFIQI